MVRVQGNGFLKVTVTRDKGNLVIHFCIVFCILPVGKDFFRYRLCWDATTIFVNAKNIVSCSSALYVQQTQTGKLKTCVTLKSSDIYYKIIQELEHMSIFSLEYWELSLKKPRKKRDIHPIDIVVFHSNYSSFRWEYLSQIT